MFSIIISEKGGAERRETFDKNEINVGRVQGNDLMLPKGNVSKHHARLLFRDGRFIVTDLKSTNGTYVNGRKIAQATIVREGDKIYIGDFVLRIEAGAAAAQGAPAPLAVEDTGSAARPPPDDGVASAPPSSPAVDTGFPGKAGPAPAPGPQAATSAMQVAAFAAGPSLAAALPAPYAPPVYEGGNKVSSIPAEPPSSSQPSSAAERALRPPSPRIEPKTGDRHEVISHFPLEHDPDESVHFAVPAPPRVPSAPKPPVAQTMPAPAPVQAPPPVAPAPQGAPGQRPQPTRNPAPQAAPPPMAGPRPAGPPGPPQLPRPEDAVSAQVLPPAPSAIPPTPVATGAQPAPGPTAPATSVLPSQAFPTAPPVSRPEAAAAQGDPAALARRAAPSAGAHGPDPAHAAARRAALLALLERVAAAVDPKLLADGAPPDEAAAARIDRALADAAAPLRGQPELDAQALIADARRELCEHGPLTPLLKDEDVTEIQVIRHDYVVAMHGRRQVPSEVAFSSEEAVRRAIQRLCLASGRPLGEGEAFVERRLAPAVGAGRLFAVMPRAEDQGHMVVIRKPQRADLTLEDLVRSGTISRAMAGLLAQCVAARANILVTGPVGAGTTTLIGALARRGSTDDRVVVLQEDDELIFTQPHTLSILLGDTPAERARAVQAAARVRPDRLVVGAFAGPLAAEVVDAIGDGVDGVIAGARAPTLRHAVLRLTADLAATRPGLTADVAREWLASAFDLAIEVARLARRPPPRAPRGRARRRGRPRGAPRRLHLRRGADGRGRRHRGQLRTRRASSPPSSRTWPRAGVTVDPSIFSAARPRRPRQRAGRPLDPPRRSTGARRHIGVSLGDLPWRSAASSTTPIPRLRQKAQPVAAGHPRDPQARRRHGRDHVRRPRRRPRRHADRRAAPHLPRRHRRRGRAEQPPRLHQPGDREARGRARAAPRAASRSRGSPRTSSAPPG